MKTRKSVVSWLLITVMLISLFVPFTVQAASKKTVYVLKERKIPLYTGTGYVVYQYKYNSKGLLTEISSYQDTNPDEVMFQVVYKYNSDNLVSGATISETGSKRATVKYSYDKNKLLKKRVTTFLYNKSTAIVTYTVKNGKITAEAKTYKGVAYFPDSTTKRTYKYDKKGHVTTIVQKNAVNKDSNRTITCSYDSHGFLKKAVFKGESEFKRILTYKNNILVKYQDVDKVLSTGETFEDNPRTLSWTKMSVPASVTSLVQHQQEELINNFGIQSTDFYLGYDYL